MILVNNLRIKLDRLCMAIEELAQKGPLKQEELRGLTDYEKYGEYTSQVIIIVVILL